MTLSFKPIASLMCGAMLFSTATAFGQSADEIRATAEEALSAFNIPGLAVVAVKDNKVVLAEGFGVRDIGNGEPVTANTLFGVASHTKAFTAAALATLVEQNKLRWDDKVIQYIPEFRLSDPAITAELTIRDLLSHRSGLGLGAGDLMIWPNTDKSTADILAGIAHVPFASGLRERFAYNNLMFVTAGEVIARASGMPYNDYVRETLLEPLGMTDTVLGYSNIPSGVSNVAIGTIEMNDELHRFPLDYLEDFAAAGAMASNANDFAKWLLAQIAQGKSPSGSPVFSADSQRALWQVATPLSVSASAAENGTHYRGYALGWFVKNEHGVKHVYHSGGILGMLSLTTIIPERNFAITVMSNQQAFGALTAITQEALEDLLELPDRDWVAEESEKYREFMNSKAEFKMPAPDVVRKALPLVRYVGSYQDAWYGAVDIGMADKKLRINFTHTPMLKGTLEHYNGDTFVVRWDEPLLEADAYIDFEVNRSNEVTGAKMEAVAPFTDFSFDFHNLDLKRQP
ncbi:serine hydrolase [Pseudidiomarina gelatinasegens]|uniref:serine hydrolase n=1 Tax=Pseudidiomarina gelatinasegens TaxID=2487740 RepID=UPI003A969D54